MAEKEMAPREERAVTREETRSTEQFVRPAVDILETEEGLTIIADLPGVRRETLDLNIDKGILTIQGEAADEAKGGELYREFSLVNYYRQFQIPEIIDQEKTAAQYENGVLTLQLFKAEHAKPKKIKVSVA